MIPRFTLPLAIIALSACHSDSPETKIQKAFDACVKAIEDGDASVPVEVLSPHFAGPEGMSRDEAKLYLMGLLRNEKIGITVFSDRIEVKGSQALQNVELVLTSRTGGSVLPQDASHRQFLLQWELVDGEWRLRHLEGSVNP
jgi:hypothetical protein